MGFQGLISKLLRGGGSLSLQNNLKNLLQVFFGVLRVGRCSNKDNKNKNVSLYGFSKLVRQLVI